MALARSLQILLEQHLDTFLGIRFLATEYSTGKTHASASTRWVSMRMAALASSNTGARRTRTSLTRGFSISTGCPLTAASSNCSSKTSLPVIEKAKEACAKSGHAVADHFAEIRKFARIGSGTQREVAVRRTIHEHGGTMPENLPVAEHIRQVESRER